MNGSPLLVTGAIIRDGDRILISKRFPDASFPSMWEFPGGKMQPGESPQEALARELREELAIETRVGRIFEAVHHRYDDFAVLLLFYECEILDGPPVPVGCAEFRWVPRSALASYEFLPADRYLLRRLALEGSSRESG